jgi:hypothetical protein
MQKFLGVVTLACVASVLLISTLAWSQQTEQKAQPLCVIEEMRHDLGEVFEQEKYSHVFKVRNSGDADLQILNVKPG